MNTVIALISSFWGVWQESAIWLILGLLTAIFVRLYFPRLSSFKFLTRGGLKASAGAAILGTPLPLCSCSVIPAAIELRRSGASRSATVSFLVATPENGADSIALSYVLLGPIMTLARLLSALFCAMGAGFVSEKVAELFGPSDEALREGGSCCSGAEERNAQSFTSAARYVLFDLYRDIAIWLVIGVSGSAVINVLVSPETLSAFSGGIAGMILILLISIPMYVCASASTPLAAALISSGVSPGTALVFLLAGPASNFASFAIIAREVGRSATIGYAVSISLFSLACGLLLDLLLSGFSIEILPTLAHGHDMFPAWLTRTAATALAIHTAGVIFGYKLVLASYNYK